jgi:hypothetical protein
MTRTASRVIRLCAGFDLVVTGLLALPFTASVFVDTLYALDRALGGGLAAPDVGPLGGFFTNLAGVLGVLWAFVRIVRPAAWLARADAIGRCAVAALIVWWLADPALPGLLWGFVATELAGALAQLLVVGLRGRPRAPAGGAGA